MALVRKRAATRRKPGVLASFVHVDAAADAIRALRARGMRDLVVYSAAPNHEIEEALAQLAGISERLKIQVRTG